MLSIDQDIKRRQLPEHIREHLQPFSTLQIKVIIGAFTFIGLDALVLIPLLFPVIKLVLYITIPLLIFISVWGIWLLIRNAENTELESLLFLGYLGIIGSLCYFILILKYSFMLGIISPIYYVGSFLIYISLIYLFFRHQFKKYSTLEKKLPKKTPAWQYTLVTISVPAGYIAAQYIMGFTPSILLSIMSVVYFVFCIFYIFILSRSFHKYFFIKANIHLVKFANKKLNQRSGIVNGK
ncbi:hypothetical protein ELQ35_20885 [Peribacillus cavernae]|uniref:Uncharacterized protein n=1 Tax=Peribacillus cavernae TaxID=1674310 RepID=A0A433H9Y5_9BACI|nr:hypothetical protein [Peribacillus cavernae]MDQ0221245.1 hypothetical protein [Peribacillus cavernae]RUQ25124.1 hypothetical protein ELQ35_20885 [Peribacillus cavernae]